MSAVINIYGRTDDFASRGKGEAIAQEQVTDKDIERVKAEFAVRMNEQAGRLAKLCERLGVPPVDDRNGNVTISYDGETEYDVVRLFTALVDRMEAAA